MENDMNSLLHITSTALLLSLAGCSDSHQKLTPEPTANQMKTIAEGETQSLSAETAKTILEEIDSSLKFKVRSYEYLGETYHIYYSDIIRSTIQATFNIGKREESDQPLTHLKIIVTTTKPLTKTAQIELKNNIARYQTGFLKAAFGNNTNLIKLCEIPLNVTGNFSSREG